MSGVIGRMDKDIVISEIIENVKKNLTLDGTKRVFEDKRPLKAKDLTQPSDPEVFTREEIIDIILLSFNLKKRGERHFDAARGFRKVDYQVYNKEGSGFLIEAKPLNADLYKSIDSAVNQIKGIFRLAEAKEGYEGGVATDGLIWILIDKNSNIIRELSLLENFDELRAFLVGEEKFISPKTEEEISKKFYIWYNALLHGGKYKDHEDKMRSISQNACFVENVLNVSDEANRERIAQLTINRLIFIKFLQSKNIIKDDLLAYLAKQKEDVISSRLKDLFFSVMNTEVKNRVDVPEEFLKVPYLNGSLFDISEVEKKYSNYKIKANILIATIEFLDSFKFIHAAKRGESQSLDPEILGYIFEKAMTAIDRKGTGAYYTPKRITRHIAKNTIHPWIISRTNRFLRSIGYKDAELLKDIEDLFKLRGTTLWKIRQEILFQIKICDNACGSGAFLLAAATELWKLYVRISESLSDRNKYSDAWLKKEILKNNLYGIDINPNAIEIAKLRLWLWLADSFNSNNVEALPNIDYNILYGNSLIGYIDITIFKDVKTSIFDFEESYTEKTLFRTINHIDELIKKYKSASGQEAKQLKEIIEKLKGDAKNLLNGKFFAENSVQHGEKKENKIFAMMDDLKSLKPFHWGLEFYNVFASSKDKSRRGFDIIVGNPPYIFVRGGMFEPDEKKYYQNHYFKDIETTSRDRARQSGKVNTFALFIERSYDLMNDGAEMGFIIPNNLLRVTIYDVLRKYILDNFAVKQIVDLSAGVFEGVTASTIILLLEKGKPKGTLKAITNISEDISKGKINRINQAAFEKNTSYTFDILSDTTSRKLFEKINRDTEPLGKHCKYIIEGIVGSRKKDVFDQKKDNNYKKFLVGKDIGRYRINFRGKYILYDKKRLHRARPEKVFLSNKIITQRIGGGKYAIVATYDDEQYYTYASTNNILLKDDSPFELKYILTLLNSKLLNWYYINKFTNKSTLTVNISKTFLEKIPIKKATKKQQEKLGKLANRMIELNKRLQEAETEHENEQIKRQVESTDAETDDKVYELYSLTEEEIKIIEESLK